MRDKSSIFEIAEVGRIALDYLSPTSFSRRKKAPPRPSPHAEAGTAKIVRGGANATATQTRERICIRLSPAVCRAFVGQQQLSTGGRPRKTPLFDYSSTVAKEKPQGQGLAEMISAPSRGQGAGERRSEEVRKRERGEEEERARREGERERRQERSEIYSRTNGCKFI